MLFTDRLYIGSILREQQIPEQSVKLTKYSLNFSDRDEHLTVINVFS